MARRQGRLVLVTTAEALADLDEIWDWNAAAYGKSHADRYIAFLKSQADNLPASPVGRSIASTAYLYRVLRRKSKGYGHVVVFEIDGSIIRVIRYFHTAQNWQAKLTGEQG